MPFHIKNILAICLLLFPFTAKPQYFKWANASEIYEESSKFTVDQAGNTYKIGSYDGDMDLDPGPDQLIIPLKPDCEGAAYLSKFNPNGELEWTKVFTTIGESFAEFIQTDHDNNIYLFGYAYGEIDLDPNEGEQIIPWNESGKCFIIKLSSSGEFRWERHFDGKHEEVYSKPAGFANIHNGQLFLAIGFSNGELDINPNSGTYYVQSFTHSGTAGIIRMDTEGNFLYGGQIKAKYDSDGPPDRPIIRDMAIGNNNEGIIVGSYRHESDFDPLETQYLVKPKQGYKNNFTMGLTSSNELKWFLNYSSPYESFENIKITAIAINDFGELLTSGYFYDKIELDYEDKLIEFNTQGGMDAFVMSSKISTGELNWFKTISGKENDYLYDINIDRSSSKILLAGTSHSPKVSYNGQVDSILLNGKGDQDAFLATLDFDGKLNWLESLQAVAKSKAFFVHSDKSHNIYSAGTFEKIADFDFSSNEYFQDASQSGGNFMLKVNHECIDQPKMTDTSIVACTGFILPSQSKSITESGMYIDTLSTYFGCQDSLVHWDITIIDKDASFNVMNGSLIANVAGQQYQWLDCSNGYKAIEGENEQVFNPTANGSYSLATENGMCRDTSNCMDYIISNNTHSKKDATLIFPNPTLDEIHLILADFAQEISVVIRNSMGIIIQEEKFQNSKEIHVMLDAVAGIYLIEVKLDDRNPEILKVIKQ